MLANNTATNEGGAGHSSGATSEHDTVDENVASSGGALFITESQLTFSSGSCQLAGNQADYGGAIYASESKMVIEKDSYINLSTNLAMHQGGGIHAANSSIIIKGKFHLISNTAENGGAISLERNAKLQSKNVTIIDLISNRANHHGGALYINDKTNPEMCAAVTTKNRIFSLKTECFSKSVFI